MFQYRTDQWRNSLEEGVANFVNIVKDPEDFILNRYYSSEIPKGFRLEIYLANKFTVLRDGILKISAKHLRRYPKDCNAGKKFCPYCEKLVTSKRIYKPDIADLILCLFTGGFWLIFIFTIYFFLQKCPKCSYNLGGMKRRKKSK